ncbi:hypothetical protein TRAPUB_14008 [Trametes pubescens]|uniref:DnaJ homologue subfamily C member 28 conserved domain-containing protein n=1 Tax=Trametes pubescens TaxID=154538 RepID=A0A1M2VPI3_TRAPU|nr:hypothetical protein TRAPUB_14008 [Trametes pubescens]
MSSAAARRSVLRFPSSIRTSACLPHLSPNVRSVSTHDNSASSKLFEDAAREEAEEQQAAARKSSKLSALETQQENWNGDESIQHAVLRMLVDKYKPMRSGPIRSAEEKLKTAPPQVRTPDSRPNAPPQGATVNAASAESAIVGAEPVEAAPVRRYVPGEPILPGIEGHQPWHTTFKVPSHATSNIRYGNISRPPPRSARQTASLPLDEKAKRKERETKKRMEQGTRLSQARESTIDYRLGIKGAAAEQLRRPNPVSLKGWANLVEERIEKARQAGHFKTVKGRGQPIAHLSEDKNPFIGREEFLMNRIVQRQGAAPPWVEIQGELETAVAAFREVVKQSWTRRALRSITAAHPAALLPRLTLADVTALRDPEWEARERGYHDTALEELNSLVRKYNGLAPYAVRRPYYMRSVELERVYAEAGEDILRGLEERAKGVKPRRPAYTLSEDEQGGGAAVAGGGSAVDWRGLQLRDMFRDLVGAFRGR